MATELFAEMGGKVYGPLTADQIRKLATSGRLKPDDRIRKGPEGEWKRAGRVPGLFDTEPASAGTSLVPANIEPRAELVSVRTTPAQVVSAVYGHRAPEPHPAAPPPPPEFLPAAPFAPAAAQFVAPPVAPAPPRAVAPPVHAPAVFPQQPQAYYPPQPMPQAQPYPGYGYPQQQPPTVIVNNNIVNAPSQPYIARPQKSAALAALLAFLFGPLGMLYSTVPGALVMFAVNVILVIPTFGLIILITWPAGIVWAAVAANNNTG